MNTADSKLTKVAWPQRAIRYIPYIAATGILVIVPPFLSSYNQDMMAKVLIFAIFAMSFDFIFGYTGLLSLGHAAYFGLGAYTAGLLIIQHGIENFWIVAPFAVAVSTIGAIFFGIFALQVSGMYFLLVTLALAQLLFSTAEKWVSYTGGNLGMSGISYPEIGLSFLNWDSITFYYFIFLCFIISLILFYLLVNSPFGYALKGIRDSERRMEALGYHTWLYKFIAFTIAGAFAGIAGILHAYHTGVMAPSQLSIETSILVMLIVIIGGSGKLIGPLIGASVVIFVQHFASLYFPERWPLILGAIFILAVMFAKGGIAVHLSRFWRGRLDQRSTES